MSRFDGLAQNPCRTTFDMADHWQKNLQNKYLKSLSSCRNGRTFGKKLFLYIYVCVLYFYIWENFFYTPVL